MNRNEVEHSVVNADNKFVLLELPTSYGKSKLTLDRMAANILPVPGVHILIVIPRLVLITTWKDEFAKWGYSTWLDYIEFVTYVSFPNKCGEQLWDLVIFDEVHHLSQRCRDSLDICHAKQVIMLSATVGRDMKYNLKALFPDLYVCKVSTKAAISEEVLPDPQVFLIPLVLDNTLKTCLIVKNSKQKNEIRVPFSQRFNYSKVKNMKILVECTQRQFYDDLTSTISWYKKRMASNVFKNLYLKKCGDRLNWLSSQKTMFVRNILNSLQDQRTLTFCNGIAQTEELGKYCINSKNKDSKTYLEKFNEGKINHITACDMLNEGCNLVNCRVGIYASLNSSDRLIIQKLGRLLRHPDPVLVIPYYVNTRDEEIVSKMLENYNPELVTTVTSLTQIKI